MKFLRLILFGIFISAGYAINATETAPTSLTERMARLGRQPISVAPEQLTSMPRSIFMQPQVATAPAATNLPAEVPAPRQVTFASETGRGLSEISRQPGLGLTPAYEQPRAYAPYAGISAPYAGTTYQPRIGIEKIKAEVEKDTSLDNIIKLLKQKTEELKLLEAGSANYKSNQEAIDFLISHIKALYNYVNKNEKNRIKIKVLDAFYESNIEYFFKIFGYNEENRKFIIAQKGPGGEPKSYLTQLKDFCQSKIINKPSETTNTETARWVANTTLDALIFYKLLTSNLKYPQLAGTKLTSGIGAIWPSRFGPENIKYATTGAQVLASLASAYLVNRFNISANKLISSSAYLTGKALSKASDLRDKLLC